MELTPEEKLKIYEEEKTRLEAQSKIKKDKKDNEVTQGCLGFIVLVVIFALFSSCGSSKTPDKAASQVQSEKQQTTQQQPTEQQQASYKAWYADMGTKLNMYDNVWKGWKRVWDDLGNGEIDRYTAYSKIKHIDDLLNKSQHDFFEMQPPKDLSDEHKKLLKDASDKMGTAASTRRDAVKSAMEFLDNPKPSLQQNVVDNIKLSDSFAIQAASQIVKVREELKIPAPEKK